MFITLDNITEGILLATFFPYILTWTYPNYFYKWVSKCAPLQVTTNSILGCAKFKVRRTSISIVVLSCSPTTFHPIASLNCSLYIWRLYHNLAQGLVSFRFLFRRLIHTYHYFHTWLNQSFFCWQSKSLRTQCPLFCSPNLSTLPEAKTNRTKLFSWLNMPFQRNYMNWQTNRL